MYSLNQDNLKSHKDQGMQKYLLSEAAGAAGADPEAAVVAEVSSICKTYK